MSKTAVSRLHQVAVLLFLLSACAQGTPMPTEPGQPLIPPTGPQIGTVSRKQPQVERGSREDALEMVGEQDPLYNGDLLRVTQGGEAWLDFGGMLLMRLFNDSELKIEQLTASAEIPLQLTALILEKGLTGKLNVMNGRATYLTPTGAEIAVLGTTFFIVYDSDKRLTTVGNFEGTMGVGSAGVTVFVQPGHFLDVTENQPPGPQLSINVSVDQFEKWARENDSSIIAVDLLRRAPPPTPTSTPTPSPTIAVTQVITPTIETLIPVPVTPTDTPSPPTTQASVGGGPLGPPIAQVIRNAGCRAGPGGSYALITSFLTGVRLPVLLRLADSSWWMVRISSSPWSCWIWNNNVRLTGDRDRVPIAQNPSQPASTGPSGEIACTDTATLSWSPVNDPSTIQRYEWELADSAGRTTTSGQTAGTSVAVPVICGGDSGNQAYSWRVRAVNGAGLTGDYSDRLSFEVQPAGPLPIPVPVSPSEQVECSGSVTLSWSVKPDFRIDHYEWVLQDPWGESSTRGEAKETSANVAVKCGSYGYPRPYAWLVRTVARAGNASEYSASLDFSVSPDILPPPTPVPIGPVGEIACAKSVILSWSPVRDPSGIKQYEWTLGDPVEGAPNGNTTGTSTVVPVSCGTKSGPRSYTWRVRAVDGAGNVGEYTNTVFSVLAPDSQTTRPPLVDTVTLDPPEICAGPEVVSVTARVLSDIAIQSVSLSWAVNQGVYTLSPMSLVDPGQGGGFYRAEAGPTRTAGVMSLRITAVDSLRQTTTVEDILEVVDCQPSTLPPPTTVPVTAAASITIPPPTVAPAVSQTPSPEATTPPAAAP